MMLEDDAKFEERGDVWFGKWHEEFGNFPLEHKSLKIGTFIGSFYPK